MKKDSIYEQVREIVHSDFDAFGRPTSLPDILFIVQGNKSTIERAHRTAVAECKRTEIVREVALKQNWENFKIEASVVILLSILLGFLLAQLF